MKNKLIISVIFSVVVFAAGCNRHKSEQDNIFRLNMSLGLETLDPVLSNSPQTIWVLSMTNEGLVAFNKKNELIPCIAKNWDISPDGLKYTFKLRSDVKFADDSCFSKSNGEGRKVTSYDFKYCFERVNDPSTKSRGLWLFRDKIKGTREFIDSKSNKQSSPLNEITGISTPDESTLVIELYEPFAPFLSLLTMTYAFVYPKEAVEYYGNDFSYRSVGTGAFKFSKWEIDKELSLEKNPSYREKDASGIRLPYLDGIKFSFTQSVESEFLDFQNGKYDYHEPSTEMLEALTNEKGLLIDEDNRTFTLFRQPWLNTVYLIMVQNSSITAGKTSPFVNNKKLRQAINYAIDRKKIVKYVLKNRGIPAHNGPLPEGMPGYNPKIKGYEFNQQKALELLAEAGYPGGEGLELNLVISNDETQKSIAVAIQEQLKEVGISVKLEQVLQATLNTKQQDGEYAFTRGNWGADYFDPENFMALFYSRNIIPHGPNKTGYNNPGIDSMYEESIRITDFGKRMKIYNDMEKIVLDDAAWVILYYNQRVYLLQNNIKGFYLDGLNNLMLKYTKKK